MLKGLLLSIKGFFREKGHAATDLRLAGKEQIHNINQSIQALRDQHNTVAGDGILIERRIETGKRTLADLEDAIRHHKAEGNEALVQRAYSSHQSVSANIARDEELLQQTIDKANAILADIKALENDTESAERDLRDAATEQVATRAAANVEGIYKDLKGGALAGAIQHSKEQSARTEAARNLRKQDSNEDVFAYKKQSAGKSLDEILGTKSDA